MPRLDQKLEPLHFSQIIRDTIAPWATTHTERELITERAKAICGALESNSFVVVHNDIIQDLLAKVDATAKQNKELGEIVEARFPKKPLILIPN